jgi:hypothetical protein
MRDAATERPRGNRPPEFLKQVNGLADFPDREQTEMARTEHAS